MGEPFRLIFVNVLWMRWFGAGCLAGRRRLASASGRARRSTGWRGSVRPAAWRPGQMGGHKPRKLIGASRDWLLERCREKDFTLRGLVAELAERGLKVDYRSVWEFVHAEGLTHKKRR